MLRIYILQPRAATSRTVSGSVEVPAVTPTVPTPSNQPGSKFPGALDPVRAPSRRLGGQDELAGVVAVPPAHHDDHLRARDQRP